MSSLQIILGFPGSSVIKNLPASAGDADLIPGSGKSPEEGNNNPLQYSCLGNPMDRRVWWAIVHRVSKSETRLTQWSMHARRDMNIQGQEAEHVSSLELLIL